jgi:hypothetical protein
MNAAANQGRSFLRPDALPAIAFVGPRPVLCTTKLRAAVQAVSGESRARLELFLDRLAGDHRLRNNWQDLIHGRAALPEFERPSRARTSCEEQFGTRQVTLNSARRDGGPLLQAFLRGLESILTEAALQTMQFLVSQRTIRPPWHTDNNDESQPFRRFAITTGAPTLFLNVRDLPRQVVLGQDTADYEEWRIRTGVPELAACGVVEPVLLPRGAIYSWGHDEWHRAPDGASAEDLMIVGELPLAELADDTTTHSDRRR